jgi:hypothetical protein
MHVVDADLDGQGFYFVVALRCLAQLEQHIVQGFWGILTRIMTWGSDVYITRGYPARCRGSFVKRC